MHRKLQQSAVSSQHVRTRGKLNQYDKGNHHNQMPISLNPKDQVKGGLIQDVDGVLKTLRFEETTYSNGTPFVGAVGVIVLDGGDEERGLWSIGKVGDWEVQDDGKRLESVA